MQDIIPLLIIGGGPAGLMAAYAFGAGAQIFERNPFAGKKLLLSGSGQCNLGNNLALKDFLAHCGKAGNFLKPALYAMDITAVASLFEQHGCKIFTRDDGKMFPASMRSADVRDLLLKLASDRGAQLQYNSIVNKIEYRGNCFFVQTGSGDFLAEKVLISTGGKSYPETGSDGSGYALAKALGHSISDLRPALAGVEIADFSRFAVCSGISVSPRAIRCSFSPKALPCGGDVLFTHRGLSGPAIINNAHLFSSGDQLYLQLVDAAEAQLLEMAPKNSSREMHNVLKYMGLADSLGVAILKSIGIDPALKLSMLRREDRARLCNALKALPFTIKQVESWDKAMATAGGIPLREVSAKTLESRLVKGLYFAGEILDYSVPTGGFNIQIALSTGWLAGQTKTVWKENE